MMPGVRTVIAGLVLALALPQRVSAQTSCNVSLDESIVVEPGEHRPCGIVVVGHDVAVAREGEVARPGEQPDDDADGGNP